MERIKHIILLGSLLLNAVFIGFFLILNFTHYLDVPLAAYSHQKNCVDDFDQVIKLGDNLPAEQRPAVKQMFATLVCQKDYLTGRSLTEQDFSELFNKLGTPTP